MYFSLGTVYGPQFFLDYRPIPQNSFIILRMRKFAQMHGPGWIFSQSSVEKNTLESEINHKVYVKDINTGEEKKIVSVMDSTKDARHGNVFFVLPCTVRQLFVTATPNGDLLVGDNFSSLNRDRCVQRCKRAT